MTTPNQLTEEARKSLLDSVYQDLRGMAAAVMRRERPDHTLQPTALAHEAYIRLQQYLGDDPTARPDFLRLAAITVRRVLLDHARKHNAAKRMPYQVALPTPSPESAPQENLTGVVDFVALDIALDRLAEFDARKAEVVQLRFFCGLTVEEIATCLDVSPRTIAHDWSLARAWLRRELSSAGVEASQW